MPCCRANCRGMTPNPVQRWSRIVALVAVSVAVSSAAAHPKLGADVDLRISITDTSVRFDLVLNPEFIDGLVAVSRVNKTEIQPSEEAEIRAALLEYFNAQSQSSGGLRTASASGRRYILDKPNRVFIDGVEVAGTEKSFAIVRPQPETRPGFLVNPIDLIPRVHLVIDYPAKSTPKSVRLVWGTFPRDFSGQSEGVGIPVEIMAQVTGFGEIELPKLTRAEPEYTWHGSGALPAARFMAVPEAVRARTVRIPLIGVAAGLISVVAGVFATVRAHQRLGRPTSWRWKFVCGAVVSAVTVGGVFLTRGIATIEVGMPFSGGGHVPSTAEALAIFTPLHANIYRAFDFNEESQIYDALARSVDGRLLDQLYSEVYRGLIMYEEGGAVSRIKSVTPVGTEIQTIGQLPGGEASFRVLARWRVEGSVYHWGHTHTRLNEYCAEYVVAANPDGWRIRDSRTIEQFRVDAAPSTIASPAATSQEWRPER